MLNDDVPPAFFATNSKQEDTTEQVEEIKGDSAPLKLYKEMPIYAKKLIVHACHHKCGTHAMYYILKDIAENFGLKFQYCPFNKLDVNNTDIWIENHSHIDFKRINRPIVGTHMVRNPIAVIQSAYKYNKTTNEPWCNKKIPDLGKTYREITNELGEREGLIFETKNELFLESSKRTIRDMYIWDYYRPNILETRFEDLMYNFDETLRNMFKFYGWSKKQILKALEIAQKHRLENQHHTKISNDKHITNKNLNWESWRDVFLEDPTLLRVFKKNYPKDVFQTLGYSNEKGVKELLDGIDADYCTREKFLDMKYLKNHIREFEKYTSPAKPRKN